MKRIVIAICAAVLSGAAWADGYPTADRVEYVFECMRDHGGRYEHLYKCSCAIDAIARALPYETYVEASTALRQQHMPGERGGLFRDPPSVKNLAKKYREIQARASRDCNLEVAQRR